MKDALVRLLAINRAIASSLDFHEILDLVVKKAVELCSADRCVLLLANDLGVVHVAAHWGLDESRAAAFSEVLNERLNLSLHQLFELQSEARLVAVPVIHHDHVRGVLAIYRDGDSDPSRDEFLLSALADQAALALDHASRYRSLLEESEHARQELETIGRHKDEFLAMLAHELRNPLAAVVTGIQVIGRLLPDDPQLARIVEAAERQSGLMARLLDDLLDVSRVSRGRISLRLSIVVVQDVVQQAVESSMRQQRHRLHVEMPVEQVFLNADAGRLVQVISNLLSNAVKFTDPGADIWLSVVADNKQVHIRVRDEGRGISADLLPFIFDLFVQGTNDQSRRGDGLGIGLTLVRRLVEMHGGVVEARSSGLGAGAEFVIHLPLADPAQSVVDGSARGTGSPRVDQSQLRRILLVEDDDDAAETLTALLELEGHRVMRAREGNAALALARHESPDIVLLDLGLPGMDGYEVATRMCRETAPQPTIIALTGYGTPEDRRRTREAGCNYHLVKPVGAEQLRQLLESVT